MQGSAIVAEIVTVITSGLTSFATQIGNGISNAVQAMWFTTSGETQTFSVFAYMILAFAAIALAVGLTRLIFNWLSRLGGSN